MFVLCKGEEGLVKKMFYVSISLPTSNSLLPPQSPQRAVQPTGGAPKPAAKLRIATKKSARHASHRPQDRSLSENNLPTYLRLLWPLLAFLAVVVVVLAMSWVLATGNAAQVHQIYEANQLEQGVEQLLHTAAEQSLMDPGAADAAYTAAQGSTRDAAGVMYGTMTSLTFGNASLSIPPGPFDGDGDFFTPPRKNSSIALFQKKLLSINNITNKIK